MSTHGHKYEKGSEEYVENACKPCEDEGKCTAASGWCRECEENMCSSCFGHHRKGKFCKDHVLLDLSESTKVQTTPFEGFEKCQQHFNEVIKFYCPVHDQVGCGDCMILEHKACKMEYIPDKIRECKDGNEFEKISSEVESCSIKTKDFLSAIQTELGQVEDIHKKFVTDAEAFRDEIIQHVNALTTTLCNQATDLKLKNAKKLQILEKEGNDIKLEIKSMEETIQSQTKQPSKLFITSKQFKQRLKNIKRTIDECEHGIKIEEYKFQRDSHVEHIIIKSENLGIIQRVSEIDANEEKEKHELVDMDITQPLQSRMLRAENIKVNGDYLSFTHSSPFRMLNGVYIGDIKMTTGNYIEVKIIKSGGSKGSVGIGLVPSDYPKNSFPGWRKGSAGYHSDDGQLFIESLLGNVFTQPCRDNDTMGCGIADIVTSGVNVIFTRNGQKVGEMFLRTGNSLYPAVALDTKGQLVKVTLEAVMPPF